jgi:phage terminase small subunit
MKLSEKHKKFVKEYLIDLNATQAAIRAGYSAKTAYSQGQRLLKHVEVSAEITKAKQKREEKTEINAEWVLIQAAKMHQKCMQEVPVMVKGEDGQMVPSGEYKFDSAGAGKALEIVGKHTNIQAFKEKLELTGANGGPIETKFVVNFVEPKKEG